jgi:hypothetical protein
MLTSDLLVTKITALADLTGDLLFALVTSAIDVDWRAAGLNQATGEPIVSAFVQLEEDADSGNRSRVISDEIYGVIVVTKKGIADAERTAYALTDAVILAVHGKNWGYEEILFSKIDRALIANEGSVVAYKVRFGTKHVQHIPTTT